MGYLKVINHFLAGSYHWLTMEVDPPFSSWVNPLFRLGHVQWVNLTRG